MTYLTGTSHEDGPSPDGRFNPIYAAVATLEGPGGNDDEFESEDLEAARRAALDMWTRHAGRAYVVILRDGSNHLHVQTAPHAPDQPRLIEVPFCLHPQCGQVEHCYCFIPVQVEPPTDLNPESWRFREVRPEFNRPDVDWKFAYACIYPECGCRLELLPGNPTITAPVPDIYEPTGPWTYRIIYRPDDGAVELPRPITGAPSASIIEARTAAGIHHHDVCPKFRVERDNCRKCRYPRYQHSAHVLSAAIPDEPSPHACRNYRPSGKVYGAL
jgi:hypothetical protein